MFIALTRALLLVCGKLLALLLQSNINCCYFAFCYDKELMPEKFIRGKILAMNEVYYLAVLAMNEVYY